MLWAWRWALLTLFITCLPYLLAVSVAVPRLFFVGSLHLPDDIYVYLSWVKQAEEGKLIFFNRFTTDPQHGGFFNLLFLLLGILSRATHLPPLIVLHLARVGFGVAFLIKSYGLLRRLFAEENVRKAAFLLLCFSAGVGWLFPQGFAPNRNLMQLPTDLWQAETNTFLSLYLNPLFAAALYLMAFIFERLWAARQSGKLFPAVTAGLLGLILANIHSYDILIVWAVWATFLLAALVTGQGLRRNDLFSGALIFLMPLPAVWQQWRFFQTEAVFRARTLTETLSPGLHEYLLGLGILVPLGLYGANALWRHRDDNQRTTAVFLLAWAVMGLILPYLPLSFQRKLAMGIHIPWALLAGAGLVAILSASHQAALRKAGLAACVAITAFTPLRWFYAAARNVDANWCEGQARLFLSPEEAEACRWLSAHAERNGATLAAPLQFGGVAGYLPGLAGVFTYAGHWGETPDFPAKLRNAIRFYSSAMTDEERRAFLRKANIRYVYWSEVERIAVTLGRRSEAGPSPADLAQMPGLRPVFQSGTGASAVVLFRVE